jgi:hypothetical protein
MTEATPHVPSFDLKKHRIFFSFAMQSHNAELSSDFIDTFILDGYIIMIHSPTELRSISKIIGL